MILRVFLIVLEVAFITILNYYMASSYYSLDVLYCLPVIQTAHFKALQSQRSSDTQLLSAIAILCALAWSLAEAAVTWPDFPVSAFLMNVITRAVTFMVIGRVITKLWKDKENLRKDVLTGLVNRVEFIKWFEDKQVESQQYQKPYSLLFFNIEKFRALNDRLGHQVGDEALQILATTLLENSRNNDGASRIGSDEFVLLLTNADEKICMVLADRIHSAAEQIFQQNNWDISLSYGHVTDMGNSRSVHELLRVAGEKMYSSRTAQR
jgi:diguanylate cyclase (GGDEF)-like protein